MAFNILNAVWELLLNYTIMVRLINHICIEHPILEALLQEILLKNKYKKYFNTDDICVSNYNISSSILFSALQLLYS